MFNLRKRLTAKQLTAVRRAVVKRAPEQQLNNATNEQRALFRLAWEAELLLTEIKSMRRELKEQTRAMQRVVKAVEVWS